MELHRWTSSEPECLLYEQEEEALDHVRMLTELGELDYIEVSHVQL